MAAVEEDTAEASELSALSPSPGRGGRPSLLLRVASPAPPPGESPHWYLCAPLQATLLDGAEGLVSLPFSRAPAGGGVCGGARHLLRRVAAYAGPGLLISIG
jgi:hypothetical protein